MYQGKFDAKSKGQRTPDEALDTILREREEDNALRAAKKAQRDARRNAAPRSADPYSTMPAAPRGQKNTSQKAPAPAQPAGGKKPAAPRPAPAAQKSAKKQTEVEVVQQQRRGPRLGGIIFYTMYFAMIFVFFIGVFITLNWLNGWLKDY